jgi:hypothetical protein
MRAEDIVQMVEGLLDFDFEQSPSFIFATKLKNRLLEGNCSEHAETLVLAMDISLGNENIFSVSEMNRMVEAFGTLIERANSMLINNGFDKNAIVKFATRFNIKLS